MRYFWLIFAIVILSGCAGKTGMPVEQWKTGSSSIDGIVQAAASNEVVFKKQKYLASLTATLPPSKISLASGLAISVPEPLNLSDYGGELAYCGQCTQYVLGITRTTYACFFDRDDDSRFEAASFKSALGEATLANKPRYTKREIIGSNIENYKYELIYLGSTKTTVRLKYKSFGEDFNKPTYLQDIEYPINPDGMTMGEFKGLSVKFHSITHNAVTYSLSGQFDESLPTDNYVSERRTPEADRIHQEKLAKEEQIRKEQAQAREETRKRAERNKAEKLRLEKERAERIRLEQVRAEIRRNSQPSDNKRGSSEDPCESEVAAAIALALGLGYSDAKAYRAGQNAYEACKRARY